MSHSNTHLPAHTLYTHILLHGDLGGGGGGEKEREMDDKKERDRKRIYVTFSTTSIIQLFDTHMHTHTHTRTHLCMCAHILTRGYYHINWLGLCRNRKAMAKLKCSNAQHSYVGTIFSDDKLLAWQHPPSRTREKSYEDSMWQGNLEKGHTRSSLTLWHALVNLQLFIGRTPQQ